MNIHFKFICHYTQAIIVQPGYIKSKDIFADLLTKALLAPRIATLREMFK